MDKYRKCCEEVVDKVNGGSNSVEAIKEYAKGQIMWNNLDKNKYIPTLISCLENSMGLWDRGCVDVFDLIGELSKLVDKTPARQPCQHKPDAEEDFRRTLSPFLDERQLDLLLRQLPTIKCTDLKRFWYNRYLENQITGLKFFDLCKMVVPQRVGQRGWNYENFKKY